MSLSRSLARRQHRVEPRVLQRLIRAAARVYVHESGIPAEDQAAAVRVTVRGLGRGLLAIEVDEASGRFRIVPTDAISGA